MNIPFLKYKVSLCFGALILLILSAFWFMARSEIIQSSQAQANTLGSTLAIQSAESIRELVLANDLLSLNVVLDQITQDENISALSIFNVDEALLATSQASEISHQNNNSQTLVNTIFIAPITLGDAIAGSVHLELETAFLLEPLKRIQIFFWLSLCLGLALVLAVSFALSSHITEPINAIIYSIQNPDEEAISLPSHDSNEKEARCDEIALLQSACLELLSQRNTFIAEKQSISTINNDNTQARIKPLKLMASIIIIKVVNINTAIELLHPSTLSKLLNEYLFYLNKAAKLYGGRVHRYAGDSVMIAFDSRQATEEYAFNAVCCAQLFLQLMNELAQQHRAKSSQALEFRLAIHSGETFVSLDFNAKQEVFNEALIGKVIETSYFLSKQSKPSQLIISETTYEQAGGEQKLVTNGSTEITLPADNALFIAYILKDVRNDYAELIEKQCQHILPNIVESEIVEAEIDEAEIKNP